MSLYGTDNGPNRRIRRPVQRQPNEGVAPPNDRVRRLIRTAKGEYKNFTPQELRIALKHDGYDISLDVIIGVLNGK